MSYWWVNHKQTFRQEIGGGFIWSPQKNRNGARNETYLNLTRTTPGDLVFSYADGSVRGVGVVDRRFEESPRPESFGKAGEAWEDLGWKVHVAWTLLEQSLSPKEHLDLIVPLLPETNSPLQPNGNGNQGCYLAEIDAALGLVLLGLIEKKDSTAADWLTESRAVVEDDLEQARIASDTLSVTETEQLVKARRGQGVFRFRLEQIESRCRVTGVKDRRVLVASHVKPWRMSTNAEKLDGQNGLLLSPHVDRLFDRGWITFTDDGRILFADPSIETIVDQWRIDRGGHLGAFSPTQCAYLQFHREHVFRYAPLTIVVARIE